MTAYEFTQNIKGELLRRETPYPQISEAKENDFIVFSITKNEIDWYGLVFGNVDSLGDNETLYFSNFKLMHHSSGKVGGGQGFSLHIYRGGITFAEMKTQIHFDNHFFTHNETLYFVINTKLQQKNSVLVKAPTYKRDASAEPKHS
jgi:hypothetical protein